MDLLPSLIAVRIVIVEEVFCFVFLHLALDKIWGRKGLESRAGETSCCLSPERKEICPHFEIALGNGSETLNGQP